MRQARYLVKRLKRFQKELPAAENHLRQLLSQQATPEEGWDSYLAGAKAELQHMAQGMLSSVWLGVAGGRRNWKHVCIMWLVLCLYVCIQRSEGESFSHVAFKS